MIHVVTPGLLTTVQDGGRIGHQHLGIPTSGGMDPWALRMANFLVGNDDHVAALECTLTGPTLRFDRPTLVAVTGGAFRPTLGDAPLPVWRAMMIPANSDLHIGRAPSDVSAGCRAYVAVAGGVATPCVLGSRSTYVRASLGGHEGRALRAGDEIPMGDSSFLARAIQQDLTRRGDPAIARWGVATELKPRYASNALVHLVTPNHDPAIAACADALLAQSFTIAPDSDRMGFRLNGEPLGCTRPLEQLSEAVAFGTVQLPPDGSPIVLMADRQTTGGYPRLGTIATVDMPLVGQLAPGDRIRFAPISLDAAQRLYLGRERDLAQARVAIAMRYNR